MKLFHSYLIFVLLTNKIIKNFYKYCKNIYFYNINKSSFFVLNYWWIFLFLVNILFFNYIIKLIVFIKPVNDLPFYFYYLNLPQVCEVTWTSQRF